MIGVVFGLLASLGFGAGPIFARLSLEHMRSTTLAVISLIVGTAITMPIAFALHSDEIFRMKGVAFLWILMSGVLTFAIARLLNYTSVGLAGVSRATPLVASQPMFALVLATTIAGETVNALILVGTIAIFGGLILVLTQR